MVQGVRGEVSTDKGGSLRAGDDIAALNIWDVESHGFYVPALWTFPHDQYHPPLHAAGRSGDRPQKHSIISQAIFELYRVWDICLHQDHEVIFTQLGHPDFLWEPKYAAVPAIVCSYV